jgi:hypothetical protein
LFASAPHRVRRLNGVNIEIDRDFSLVALTDGHRLRTFIIHHQSSLDFLGVHKKFFVELFMNRFDGYVEQPSHLPFASPIFQRSLKPTGKRLPNSLVKSSTLSNQQRASLYTLSDFRQ